jgi:putative tricarboxylic transport membrane protein
MFWKKYDDYITSVFFIGISIVMIIMARALPKSKIMAIGPDFMPTVIGCLTLALAVILLITTIVTSKQRKKELAETKPDECDYKKMLTSLFLILVYVFILQPIGFIVATLVYLLPQFVALAPPEERNKKTIIKLLVIDIVFTLVVFFLFRYGFKIVLPAGIFTIAI